MVRECGSLRKGKESMATLQRCMIRSKEFMAANFVDIGTAAELMKRSVSYVSSLIQVGEMPAIEGGKLISKEAIDHWKFRERHVEEGFKPRIRGGHRYQRKGIRRSIRRLSDEEVAAMNQIF
jgi:hypothetical protein